MAATSTDPQREKNAAGISLKFAQIIAIDRGKHRMFQAIRQRVLYY
jgi:hypothetical protein